MTTKKSKRKLAALNKENCEEHPRSNLAQNSNVSRSQENYITQVFEEIEGRVTKRLSKEVSRTENRILGALARLEDFLMNPLLQGHSGTTPEPSWNALSTSQGTIEDDPQNDPHPEAGLFHGQMTQNSGSKDGHDMVTGVQDEIRNGPELVTGGSEEIRNGHNMVTGIQKESLYRHDLTGVHEEVTYCSPSISSGKQKKNRSTSQPQFCSENTHKTIEAD